MHLNQGYSYCEELTAKVQGQTTLSYLVERYRHSVYEDWVKRLTAGEVLLDGVIAHGTEKLRAGQVLVWNRSPWPEQPTPQSYDIIYQDEALLAVNKPSGLPTLPAGGFLDNTLLSLVRKNFPTAQPMHRLGRATSGLVVFALTPDAASSLSKLWREHKVEKYYRALASGVAQQDYYEIRAAIGSVPHPRLGLVYAASDVYVKNRKGKPSASDARVLERQSNSTLFEVKILTGRPHQIRIHLAFIGHPLQGDPLYAVGGGFLENPGLPGDGGYFLHAERLKFLHPVTREGLEVQAPVPIELRCKNE
jgi:23S rRNA pseudouridine1911/1915/1917 synthase